MPCRAGRLVLATVPIDPIRKGISEVQFSHTARGSTAVFDDPNLIASAGLVPMLALADSAGLAELAQGRLSVPTDKGANGSWSGCAVAGLTAGTSTQCSVPSSGARPTHAVRWVGSVAWTPDCGCQPGGCSGTGKGADTV